MRWSYLLLVVAVFQESLEVVFILGIVAGCTGMLEDYIAKMRREEGEK